MIAGRFRETVPMPRKPGGKRPAKQECRWLELKLVGHFEFVV
jgi:hypothetical protein